MINVLKRLGEERVCPVCVQDVALFKCPRACLKSIKKKSATDALKWTVSPDYNCMKVV